MSMSRKHYIKFADMMAELKPEKPKSVQSAKYGEEQMFYSIMQGMCEVFKQDNPNFDAGRFAKWVGEKSTTIIEE